MGKELRWASAETKRFGGEYRMGGSRVDAMMRIRSFSKRALGAYLSVALAVALVPLCAREAEASPVLRDDATVRANLVLLVKFAGDAEGDPGTTGVEAGFNGEYDRGGYRTQWEYLKARIDSVSDPWVKRSFRDYVRIISNGQYDVESYFPQTDEATGKVAYIELDRESSYYVDNDEAMISEALGKFNEEHPDYDASELDADGDGFVDNLLIIPSVRRGGTFTSHKSVSAWRPSIGTASSKEILVFNVIEAHFDSIGGMVMDNFPEGTAVHEYLHSLGARDYYRLEDGNPSAGVPVGVWDVMASSGAKSWPLAITRQTVGWCTIPEVSPDGTYTLYAPDDAGSEAGQASGRCQAVKVKTPFSSSEYFVVEYRQKKSDIYDLDTKIGGSGFIVYRVNEKHADVGNITEHGDYVYVFREGETGMARGRPDGAGAIGTAQVSMPAFASGGNRCEIGSIDMSKGLSDGAICYSDGQNSGLRFKPVEQTDGSITVEISHADWTGAEYWQEVLDSANGTAPFGVLDYPTVDVAAGGSNMYVLAREQTMDRACVWKYDTAAKTWGQCGPELSDFGNAKMEWFGGSLYIAGSVSSVKAVQLKRLDGASWVDVASTPAADGDSGTPYLAESGGSLYVLADSDGAHSKLYRLDGTSLVQQGDELPIESAAHSIVVDWGNGPAVVSSSTGATWETGVYRQAGASWVKVSTIGTSASSALSAVSVGDCGYVLAHGSNSAMYLAVLGSDGAVDVRGLPSEVASSLSLSSSIASDGTRLYLSGSTGSGMVRSYFVPLDDADQISDLGGSVYRTGSEIASVLVGGKVYCAIADHDSSTITVRTHDAVAAPNPPDPTDPPSPPDPGTGDGGGGENPDPGGQGGSGDSGKPVQKAEKELAGSTRIGTAIAVAREAYPEGPKGVIIARSSDFPDALAASTLAGAKDYPILLNPSAGLDPELRAYLRDSGSISEAILIGDENSLPRSMEAEIGKMVPSVSRIGGDDRFDTARLLRDKSREAGAAAKTAVISRSDEFPDALSISPYCAATGALLYIVTPGSLLDKKALQELSGYDQVIIVGDSNAVSAKLEKSLKAVSKKVVRLAGGVGNSYPKTRYGTSQAISSWLVTGANAGFSVDRASFATGKKFPDALAGGPFCGKLRCPIVLVDTVDYTAIGSLASRGRTSGLYWLGSTDTLPLGLRGKIKKGLGY